MRASSRGTRRSRFADLLIAATALAACGKTHAAQFSRWGLDGRCIPPEPPRFAGLCVALRSKYTRASSPGGGSSLVRLVSRAPRPSRRSRGFHHRLLAHGLPFFRTPPISPGWKTSSRSTPFEGGSEFSAPVRGRQPHQVRARPELISGERHAELTRAMRGASPEPRLQLGPAPVQRTSGAASANRDCGPGRPGRRLLSAPLTANPPRGLRSPPGRDSGVKPPPAFRDVLCR